MHPGYRCNRNLDADIDGIQVHSLLGVSVGNFAGLPNLVNKKVIISIRFFRNLHLQLQCHLQSQGDELKANCFDRAYSQYSDDVIIVNAVGFA